MRKVTVAILAAALSAIACAPTSHIVSVDMRYPSSSGIDLIGKTVSVTFVQNNPKDSTFLSAVADGFAYALEKEYFSGESAIDVFEIKATEGADYSSRDTLVNLVMSTSADIAFLFDECDYIYDKETLDTAKFRLKLYAYDSMDKADTVRYTSGVRNFRIKSVNSSAELASTSGSMIADFFDPTWKTENYTFYYYDNSKWLDAVIFADNYQWNNAIKKFLEFVDTNDLVKRSCASFDIAICCYMLEYYDLALEWLDRSDADYKMPTASTLRSRIKARMK